MHSITELLDLEDTEIIISDISVSGQTKTITIETPPIAHYCPSCGFKMHSRGIKKRTIRHPILQDTYDLILVLKQRRWRCTNPDCLYDVSDLLSLYQNKGVQPMQLTCSLLMPIEISWIHR